MIRYKSILCALLALGAVPAAPAGEYNDTVRRILSDKCFKCHGPDEPGRKARLRLDQPAGQDWKEVMARILSTDPDERMPPPEANKTLSAEQVAAIESWIGNGAKYETHWAFVPPKIADPSLEKSAAIDHYIEAGLDGLPANPPADPHTLVRRLYLDLVGVPPSAEETRAFVRDPSPAAWEALVDRLLDSPKYGERWARRWLDLARYADTNGYEKDRPRSIWPYRDWVIRALNADLPFDRFTIEQLAGDLLPDATRDQRVATGFHRNTMLNEEGGIDPLEFRFHAMADRVGTTGTTWLGLTTACAQCHTHKYDPITHHEYYGLMAFLNNADEPEFDLPTEAQEAQVRRNRAEADRLLAELPKHWPAAAPAKMEWQPVDFFEPHSAQGATVHLLGDPSTALFSGKAADTDTYTLSFDARAGRFDGLKLEALTHDKLPARGPGRTDHGNFVLSEIEIEVAPVGEPAKKQRVRIASARADVEQPNFPVAHAFDGKADTGWAVHAPGQPLNRDRWAAFHLAEPAGFADRPSRVTVTLRQEHGGRHTLGRVRLSLGKTADGKADDREAEIQRHFEEWVEKARSGNARWTPVLPAAMKSNLPHLARQPDGSIYASGDITKHDTYELEFAGDHREPVTAIRLEALPDPRLPAHGPGMTFYEGRKGEFFLGEFEVWHAEKRVAVVGATETYAKNQFGKNPVSAALATDGDLQTGWSTAGRYGERHVAVFPLDTPIPPGSGYRLVMHFGRHFASSLGRFRISATSADRGFEASDLPFRTGQLLHRDRLQPEERRELFDAFLLQAPELAGPVKRIHELRKHKATTTTLILRERPADNPRPTHLHHRGEYTQPREEVHAHVPAALHAWPEDLPRDRLGLAKWLVHPDNPLTARVTVNRHWAAFFGQGLVRTLDDFGMQGEMPSHPELLDWLAVTFMEEGWSVKRLHRRIVTSEAYRRSSTVTSEQLARDLDNRRLARTPRFRLEAEILRDAVLVASGLLSDKMYGPPVRPPQPPGITEVAFGKPKWIPSSGEDRHRRSVYTHIKRTAPFAMITTFDGSSGEACVARRERSNSALQALTLLNDPMFIEAAQALGKRLAEFAGDDGAKIEQAFLRVLARPPAEDEAALFAAFVARQRARIDAGELKAEPLAGKGGNAESAVWTGLARALFNLDETLTRN